MHAVFRLSQGVLGPNGGVSNEDFWFVCWLEMLMERSLCIDLESEGEQRPGGRGKVIGSRKRRLYIVFITATLGSELKRRYLIVIVKE